MGYPTPAPPATLSADELAYYVDPTTVQMGNLYTGPKDKDCMASRATILREDSLGVELRAMQDSEEGLPTQVVQIEPHVVHHNGH